MLIRRANEDDGQALFDLDSRCHGGRPVHKIGRWRHYISGRDVLLASQGQKAIGVILIKEYETGSHISDFMVDPEFQNHPGFRVGTKLLESALAVADTLTGNQYLWVKEGNDRALHLYEKFGFAMCPTDRMSVMMDLAMERRPFSHILKPQ